jgi:transcriptional regulator with XRE-family HTH domain
MLDQEFSRLPLSEQLQLLRNRLKLTPTQLAKKAGVTVLTVNLYESPYYEQYEIKTLSKIVAACGGEVSLSIQIQNDLNG